jgi:hypothetical protein
MNERMSERIMILKGLSKAAVVTPLGITPALRKWSQDNNEKPH